MYNNGVTHKTEPRDLDGVYTAMKWLSYIAKVSKLALLNLEYEEIYFTTW